MSEVLVVLMAAPLNARGLRDLKGPSDKSGLFEACKNGDLERVASLLTPDTVNSRDEAGRRSTPLHFAAGKWNP